MQKSVSEAYGDLNMRSLAKGDVIQLERKGYWIVDVAPDAKDPQQPAVLLDIPDGRVAKSPAAAAPAADSKVVFSGQTCTRCCVQQAAGAEGGPATRMGHVGLEASSTFCGMSDVRTSTIEL